MVENQLQKGISILYDMEKNNYLMTRAINNLDEKIRELGHKRKIYAPNRKENEGHILEGIWTFGTIGVYLGALIGIVVGLISLWLDDMMVIFKIIFGLLILGVYGVIGVAIGAVAAGIVGLIFGILANKDENKKNETEYQNDVERYNRNIKADKVRIDAEMREKSILTDQRNKLVLKLQESKCRLIKYYNIMGIDEKFRNLIPMAYMHEMIRLGISSKLDGVDGLYYLTLQELKDYQMNCTLERICEKLDTIIDNQRDIKNELRQVNITCDNMLLQTMRNAEELARSNTLREQIANNTAVAAYNTERILCEERYQSFMLTYNL